MTLDRLLHTTPTPVVIWEMRHRLRRLEALMLSSRSIGEELDQERFFRKMANVLYGRHIYSGLAGWEWLFTDDRKNDHEHERKEAKP